jgi:DNA-directed RNA polymerase subunit RPC12/RpoP
MLIERALVTTDEIACDNEHHLVVRNCHYREIDNKCNMLYGPADRPKVSCPECRYRMGDHGEYIYRLGKDDDMQYILRTISSKSDRGFHHVSAITRSTVSTHDQVSTVNTCPNCGLNIHFNYSNKAYNEKEKFKGFKQQL